VKEKIMLPPAKRITHQREIILQKLRSVTSHPTADELYMTVKEHLPRISIATVYRNLEWLVANGLAQKIEVSGRPKRFDGTVQPHYHVRCQMCGKVEDAVLAPLEDINSRAEKYTGYTICGHSIEFYGICPACGHDQKNSAHR